MSVRRWLCGGLVGVVFFFAAGCEKKKTVEQTPPPVTQTPVEGCRCPAGTIISRDGSRCEPGPKWQCPAGDQPVCGCDNQTYKSYCDAANAGLARWQFGECKPSTPPTPPVPPPGSEVKVQGDSAEILYDSLKRAGADPQCPTEEKCSITAATLRCDNVKTTPAQWACQYVFDASNKGSDRGIAARLVYDVVKKSGVTDECAADSCNIVVKDVACSESVGDAVTFDCAYKRWGAGARPEPAPPAPTPVPAPPGPRMEPAPSPGPRPTPPPVPPR